MHLKRELSLKTGSERAVVGFTGKKYTEICSSLDYSKVQVTQKEDYFCNNVHSIAPASNVTKIGTILPHLIHQNFLYEGEIVTINPMHNQVPRKSTQICERGHNYKSIHHIFTFLGRKVKGR